MWTWTDIEIKRMQVSIVKWFFVLTRFVTDYRSVTALCRSSPWRLPTAAKSFVGLHPYKVCFHNFYLFL
jgi:hypothetical protein